MLAPRPLRCGRGQEQIWLRIFCATAVLIALEKRWRKYVVKLCTVHD